ncbi:MAG: helix-turn-helix domain-containing protein [Deltaproteobacteria bacterium]
MPDRTLSSEDVETIIARIREELARRRISRQRLADDARISISTLEKVLSGRRAFTLATLLRLEDALGISLRPLRSTGSRHAVECLPIAPDDLGNYVRAQAGWLEGSYVTLTPSFGERLAISAYRTDIRWDDAESSLIFSESERSDIASMQRGRVAMPMQAGHIYLVTSHHGQQRLTILSRPTSQGSMHGILATLLSGKGAQQTPVAAPIALLPIASEARPVFGRISQGQTDYVRYRALLRRTLDDSFAVLMPL